VRNSDLLPYDRMSLILHAIALVLAHWLLPSQGRNLQKLRQQASAGARIEQNLPEEVEPLETHRQARLRRPRDSLALLVFSFSHPAAGYQLIQHGCTSATDTPVTRGCFTGRLRAHVSLVCGRDLSLQHDDACELAPTPCGRHGRLPSAMRDDEEALHPKLHVRLIGCAVTLGILLASTSAALAIGGSFSDTADKSFHSIVVRSFKKGLGGGISGFLAAVLQVLSLMWLDTTTKYQHRHGGDLKSALKVLINEGGFFRLYRGLPMALINLPLIRSGQMAANEGVLALLSSFPQTEGLSLATKNLAVTLAAATWRILCLPVDTLQVSLQVGGRDGWRTLMRNLTTQGPGVLFNGKTSVVAFALAGSFPWYMTFNYLDQALPLPPTDAVLLSLLRSACLGLSASCASDTVSNSMRVIMTNQQASMMSIGEALRRVIKKDGVIGLFGRGLKTRLIMNGFQTAVFSVFWKSFQAARGAR